MDNKNTQNMRGNSNKTTSATSNRAKVGGTQQKSSNKASDMKRTPNAANRRNSGATNCK